MRVLILANNDIGLYKFRKELLQELLYPGTYIKGRKAPPVQVYIAVPDGDYINLLKKMGCSVIKTPIDRRGANPIKDLKLMNMYRAIIDKIKPDCVLTYTIKPNIYGGFLCGIKRIKYISNITGLGTAIESNDFMSRIILVMYKIAICKSNTVFFQNDKNRLFFKEHKIVKEGYILPGSGVNLDEHKFEEYPQDENLKFLFIGRIMKDKGIDEFLGCATHIKKRYPYICFDMLGDFDEERYRSKVEKLQKDGVINYYGQQDDVHSFIKTHHATILPTYHEGLSNVLLESASAGRPVIATDIPGCKEAFDDGVTGIGFKPKSQESLIRAVENFISLPYERKRQMGIAAREKIIREFDRKIVINAYLNAMKLN